MDLLKKTPPREWKRKWSSISTTYDHPLIPVQLDVWEEIFGASLYVQSSKTTSSKLFCIPLTASQSKEVRDVIEADLKLLSQENEELKLQETLVAIEEFLKLAA